MPYRQPEQSYYPRSRLRMIIRFEDYGDPGTPDPPKRIPPLRKGAKDQGAPGTLVVQNAGGILYLVQPGTTPNANVGGPQDQTSSADGRTHVVDGIIPQSSSLELNGVRQADKLTATLSLADFPFDPRTIKSCAVKFYLGCVSADDQARGVAGEMRANATSSGSAFPFFMIPDDYVDAQGRQRTNLRFEGWVDTSTMVLDQDSATIQIDCADNTRLFIDQDHPAQLYVAKDKPIDLAIANYLASFPQFVGFGVEYRPSVSDDLKPQLDKVLARTATRPENGPPQGAATQKVSVWDYLTDVAGMVGHIIRVEGTTVVIQRPRTLYAEGFSRKDDPFQGRVIEGAGQPPLVLKARMYGYGANAMSLSIERGYAKRAPTNIEIRSYDTERKKTIYVRFPEVQAGRIKNILPGQAAELKFTIVRVQGITDPATLRLVAQAHYESRNRNEIIATLKSANLGSFGGDNLDPDALDMREGDPVQIQIVRSDELGADVTVPNLAQATVGELEQRGFKADLAAAYVAARDRIALPTTFRVRTLKFDTTEKGVVITVDAINYVSVVVDRPLPDGEEIQPEDQEPLPQVITVDEGFG